MKVAETVATSPVTRFQLRSTLIAILIPLLIAASHQWVLQWFLHTGYRASWQVAICYGLFVLQVGIAGAIAGRFISGTLSWFVFGWTLLVIDLLTFCMAVTQRGWFDTGKVLACALISGQLGAVVVWGVLGEQRWTLRVPITVVLGTTMLLVWGSVLRQLSYFNDWFPLMLMQNGILLAICLFFLQRGCRLKLVVPGSSEIAANAAKGVWQFNLKDAFILTTAVAIIMGVFRMTAGTQQYTRGFFISSFVAEVILSTLLAVVVFVALWTTFGQRRWYVRFAILTVVASAVGTFVGWTVQRVFDWTDRLEAWLNPANSRASQMWYLRDAFWFTYLGWWWLPWICLSCAFVVATLWVFREKGYRVLQTNQRNLSQ